MRRPTQVAYFKWSENSIAGLPVLSDPTPAWNTTGQWRWNLTELPLLGKGTTRAVYDLSDGTVVKTCKGMPHAHRVGYCPCEAETANWAKFASSPNAELFAPVLEGGECWNRMVKADSVPVPCLDGCPNGMPYDADWFMGAYRAIKEFYNIDIHPGQFGIFGGKYKLLDYGI